MMRGLGQELVSCLTSFQNFDITGSFQYLCDEYLQIDKPCKHSHQYISQNSFCSFVQKKNIQDFSHCSDFNLKIYQENHIQRNTRVYVLSEKDRYHRTSELHRIENIVKRNA